ncbi:MAG: polysaccharide deacetylase family protein [Firmicutes bacterium]|nr:polysaccharide deacetylase family protein [Bacillota bacterium]
MIRKLFWPAACILISAAGLFSYIHGLDTLYNARSTSAAISAPLDYRESVEIPIIMYHGLSAEEKKESDYVITSRRFEEDLKWLAANHYTTILPSQLISYVNSGAKLPPKPVILTFDDGYANNYSLAFPLLQQYDAKAVIAIIGSQSDISSNDIYRDGSYGNISWGEATIMSSSGLVEFASHTYCLHQSDKGKRKGADRLAGESFEVYRQVLLDDLSRNQALIKQATGKEPRVFAWPYGAYPMDGCADQILRELGFDATFTSYQHTSSVKAGVPESLYGLGRYLRTPAFDITTIAKGHL